MVIVHEIKDEDEFEAQLVQNDSFDDYTTEEDDGEEGDELMTDTFKKSKSCRWNVFAYLPLSVRRRLSALSLRAWSTTFSMAKWAGKAAWIITTSMVLIGLPLLFAYDREKSLVEYEKEQQRFAPPVASS